MSRQLNTNGGRVIATRLVIACAILAAITVSAKAQDTLQNTSGEPVATSALNALPPPTPPSIGMGGENQSVPQPGSPERAQALEASQNAAFSVEQPNQDQSLLPPQPPTQSAAVPVAGSRAQLGIQMLASVGPGVQVTNVLQGSAAELAGIRPGDYLLAVGSQTVELPNEVANIVLSYKPGDAIQLRIWRDRSDQLVTANLQEMREARVPTTTTVNRPVYSDDPLYYQSNVVTGSLPRTIYRQYYYPNNYSGYGYGYAPYGYRYGWGNPYGGAYYGNPRFGYWNSPWGEGVNIGGFRFGWR